MIIIVVVKELPRRTWTKILVMLFNIQAIITKSQILKYIKIPPLPLHTSYLWCLLKLTPSFGRKVFFNIFGSSFGASMCPWMSSGVESLLVLYDKLLENFFSPQTQMVVLAGRLQGYSMCDPHFEKCHP